MYNRGAARLRTGTSGTIGLIVPEITNPFYAELTAGIDETFDAEEAETLTFLANLERPARAPGAVHPPAFKRAWASTA